MQLALTVAFPEAGNIGGGGFMVLREPNGKTAALDFREKAPMRAYRDMYLDSAGNVIDKLSTKGALACGVPGSVGPCWAIARAAVYPAIPLSTRHQSYGVD